MRLLALCIRTKPGHTFSGKRRVTDYYDITIINVVVIVDIIIYYIAVAIVSSLICSFARHSLLAEYFNIFGYSFILICSLLAFFWIYSHFSLSRNVSFIHSYYQNNNLNTLHIFCFAFMLLLNF